jgi:TonB family protein
MKKSEQYGAVGTILFSIILVLILLFFGLSISKEEREEGIMVSFGDGLDGEGAEQAVVAPPVVTPPPPSRSSTPSNDDLMTQEDPSVALNAKREKERLRREQEEQRRLLEQQRQEEIRRQLEIERQRLAAAAERQRKIDEANARMSGAFGSGGNASSGTGTGSSGTGSTPGNPLGQGSSGGNTWSLTGRSLESAFYRPNYVSDSEGTVVVNITVDKSGTVIGATIGQGTDISDEALRKECIAAAKRLRFNTSSQSGNAVGRITYKFELK